MVSVANTYSPSLSTKWNDSGSVGSGGGGGQPLPPPHTISAKVRKMIQSIKEIVGSEFSDTEVYLVLKETNMDPNESTQQLLNQDPFREVKRRNRKKEPRSLGHRNSEDSRKISENISQVTKVRTVIDRGARHGGGYTRTAIPGNGGMNKEFRVVKDNTYPKQQQGSEACFITKWQWARCTMCFRKRFYINIRHIKAAWCKQHFPKFKFECAK